MSQLPVTPILSEDERETFSEAFNQLLFRFRKTEGQFNRYPYYELWDELGRHLGGSLDREGDSVSPEYAAELRAIPNAFGV